MVGIVTKYGTDDGQPKAYNALGFFQLFLLSSFFPSSLPSSRPISLSTPLHPSSGSFQILTAFHTVGSLHLAHKRKLFLFLKNPSLFSRLPGGEDLWKEEDERVSLSCSEYSPKPESSDAPKAQIQRGLATLS